ncbi:MAG: hypothetical protein ACKO38_05470 [Planctomycetota bacterium]
MPISIGVADIVSRRSIDSIHRARRARFLDVETRRRCFRPRHMLFTDRQLRSSDARIPVIGHLSLFGIF